MVAQYCPMVFSAAFETSCYSLLSTINSTASRGMIPQCIESNTEPQSIYIPVLRMGFYTGYTILMYCNHILEICGIPLLYS